MSLTTLRTLLQRLIVVALIVAVAVGLRSAGPASADTTGWRASLLVDRLETVGIVLVAVLIVPSLVLVVWAGGEGPSRRPARRRRSTTTVLLVFALTLAVGLWLADHRPWDHHPVRPPKTVDQPRDPVVSPAARAGDGPPWLLLSGLGVVTVAAVVLSSRRRRTEVEEDELELPAADGPEPAWHAGVQAAAAALRSRPQDPPRARVLSAYEAFEAALAEQGVVRGASGTATGLLDRAVAEGFPAADALRLTELFSAARYGEEAVTADDVLAAERALSAVLAATA